MAHGALRSLWLSRVIASAFARIDAAISGVGAWARRQPPLRAVLTVWSRLLDEACGLIDPLLQRIMPERRLVAVVNRDGGLDFYAAARGGAQAISDPALPQSGKDRALWRTVELRLRADQLLQRSLTLPAASRDYLAPIVEHRLERLTPWRRDKVLHGFRSVGTGEGAGSIEVALLLTSADLLAPPLAALRDRGFTPTAIGGQAESPAEPLQIVLQRGAAEPLRPALHRTLGRLWLSGTLTLGALAVAVLVWSSAAESRHADADRHLVKARRLIRETSGGDSSSREQTLIAEKQPDKAMVTLIDKLATVIPSNSFLHEMAITPTEVRLVGTSSDAAALIPLLEAAGFYNVRFTAPVTRDNDRLDGFEITADRAAVKPEAP